MKAKIDGRVRIAIIGTGGISHPHANGILAHCDKVECTALCDVSEVNLKARSEQLGGIRALYGDWRKMLDEAGDTIDAVDICLPHHLHAPAILDAAAAGKHILCEKPMCMNLKEADKIAATVKKAGVIYMSAHNQLFMPIVQEAKKMIAERNRSRRIIARYESQKAEPKLPMELHVLRIGDIAFASNRFELYMDFQHRIQARSPFEQTFIVQLAGTPGSDGGTYLATERGAWGRGYSASMYCNIVSPQGGQELVEETVKILKHIHPDK